MTDKPPPEQVGRPLEELTDADRREMLNSVQWSKRPEPMEPPAEIAALEPEMVRRALERQDTLLSNAIEAATEHRDAGAAEALLREAAKWDAHDQPIPDSLRPYIVAGLRGMADDADTSPLRLAAERMDSGQPLAELAAYVAERLERAAQTPHERALFFPQGRGRRKDDDSDLAWMVHLYVLDGKPAENVCRMIAAFEKRIGLVANKSKRIARLQRAYERHASHFNTFASRPSISNRVVKDAIRKQISELICWPIWEGRLPTYVKWEKSKSAVSAIAELWRLSEDQIRAISYSSQRARDQVLGLQEIGNPADKAIEAVAEAWAVPRDEIKAAAHDALSDRWKVDAFRLDLRGIEDRYGSWRP